MASVILSKDGRCLAVFQFEDRLRSDAREAIAALVEDGLAVEVLSGDREATSAATRFSLRRLSPLPGVSGWQGSPYCGLRTKGSDGGRWA